MEREIAAAITGLRLTCNAPDDCMLVSIVSRSIMMTGRSGTRIMKAAEGDEVVLHAPGGTETLTVLEVRYERIAVEPFDRPLGSEVSTRLHAGERLAQALVLDDRSLREVLGKDAIGKRDTLPAHL
jgi:hypothetical protein